MPFIDEVLAQLDLLMELGKFENLETDTLEIKPVPSEKGQWHECYKSINAFLNTRGGIVLLGIKEEKEGQKNRYVLTGWHEHAEPKLKAFRDIFTDRHGRSVEFLVDAPVLLRNFRGKRVALVYVDELPADKKYVFYQGAAYERLITGDHKIEDNRIDAQEEFKEEAVHAKELTPIPNTNLDDVDLDKLNEYIHYLNRPNKVESIKPTLKDALPFLTRKSFIVDRSMTTLGMLVCGTHPEDSLVFRCQVHGYVEAVDKIAEDKQDLSDNILPLMEASLAYVMRNIRVGVGIAEGGSYLPEYPERLLRETINNALAHRDYSINKHCILSIKPGQHLAIQNPGSFRRHLLVEEQAGELHLMRIIPEAQPRNPKLADVLRVFRKWEGRAIGMATLVNLCLENKIDLPYYRFLSDEVRLYLRPGRLVDDRIDRLLQSYDDFLEQHLAGSKLTDSQKAVLAYLMKSEWANESSLYTILLTPDNNHFQEINRLEQLGLIYRTPRSSKIYPVFLVNRLLMTKTFLPRLQAVFGDKLALLNSLAREVLEVIYRFNNFSKTKYVNAKQTSFFLWDRQTSGGPNDIKAFDAYYRKVRSAFNSLEKKGFVEKRRTKGILGYKLRDAEPQGTSLFDGS